MRKMSDLEAGRECGKTWARDTAKKAELKRLTALVVPGDNWEDVFVYDGRSAHGPDVFVVATIMGTEAGHDEASAFWEAHAGTEKQISAKDADFLRGFAEGAIEVAEEK